MNQCFDINPEALVALPMQHIDGFSCIGDSKWFAAINSTISTIKHGRSYLLRVLKNVPVPVYGIYTYAEGKDFNVWVNRVPTSPAPKTICEYDDDEPSCDYLIEGEVVGWYYAERPQDGGAELHAPKGNAG